MKAGTSMERTVPAAHRRRAVLRGGLAALLLAVSSTVAAITETVIKAPVVQGVEQAYIDAWRIGAKAVSIYRDGSKRTQPLNTSKDKQPAAAAAVPRIVARLG